MDRDESRDGGAAASVPLWRKELRQAIAAAIDREEIVGRAFAGHGSAAYHMVPPGYPYADEPFRERYGTRDLEQARRLLRGLGYSPDAPFTFDLWHPPQGHYGTSDGVMLEALKDQLEETGLVAVRLRSKRWVDYVDSFLAGELPAFIIGWSPDFVDPDNWLSPFASSTQSPDQGVNFHDPEMSALLSTAAASTDAEQRRGLYQRIGARYAEEVPTVPLYWDPAVIAYRTGVEGVAVGPPFEFNYHVLRFGEGSRPASGRPDTLVLGKTFEVQSLDANDAHARSDWEVLKNTGESLLSYRPGTAELTPGTAELASISPDGRTYTFKLRPGLRFADGTPLSAENYLYAWRRYNTLRGQVSGLVRIYVEEVETPEEDTVVYHLRDRFGFFPAVTASPAFIPVNPKLFPMEAVNRFPERLDGVGRYRMVSHRRGDEMVLEKNPLCALGEAPAIPRIVIRYFPGSLELAGALEAGAVDIAWRKLGWEEASGLRDRPDLRVETISTPLLRYLVFNHAFAA
jgi:peptide/nickel transport system substrate-binding protein